MDNNSQNDIRESANNKAPYAPDQVEFDFIMKTYGHFILDRNLKDKAQTVLGGKTLKQFWEDSEYDYNNLCQSQLPNDPIVPYSSGVSRDKANIFITNLALNLFYPTVVAQNNQQEEDRIFSRASRAMLEYAHENDGRPAESGHQKFVRYVHKNVIQGTVHIQDDIIDGKLESSLVPNEEILVPNFYQPNIQLQSRLMRVQDSLTYEDAEREFGGLKKFKDYVYPSMSTIFSGMNDSKFQDIGTMIDMKNKCQVVRIWSVVPRHKLVEYKRIGKLPSYVKKAKYFNVLCNGVLLFDPENLSPYHDGGYPINKGIFEMFSRPEYYWGNSLPNKIKEDKKWKDGWKTLLRWKGKMSAIPPLITYNGTFVDSDIVIPGMITQAPAGMGKGDVETIPGLSAGIDSSDIALEQSSDTEIDRATVPPQMGGQTQQGRQTAREVVLADANANKILNSFALQIMFLVSSRSFPIIMRMFQFKTREEISKIAIPNQMLPDGSAGTMQIIFFNSKKMSRKELEEEEYEIYKQDKKASKRGVSRQSIYIRKDYWAEIDLYLKATVENMIPETPAIRQAKADMKFNRYSSRPDLFNQKSAAKMLVRENGDDEDEMLVSAEEEQRKKEEQAREDQASNGGGSGSGQNSLSKMTDNPSALADSGTGTPTV